MSFCWSAGNSAAAVATIFFKSSTFCSGSASTSKLLPFSGFMVIFMAASALGRGRPQSELIGGAAD